MSRKALKVVVEVHFMAVSCPGVHLPGKDDIYLSVCIMGQYHKSKCLPAIFPLLFHEKMTFEKMFRHAVDPGDIAVMLEYECVRIELMQLIPPAGEALACFEEHARFFLFPEPKLVPTFSGEDREVLMIRAPHFPGITPRMEFSTKTTISECSADAGTNFYQNIPTTWGSWPGAWRSAVTGPRSVLDIPMSPSPWSPRAVRHPSEGRREISSDGSLPRKSSGLWWYYREQASLSRSRFGSQDTWEEVQERIRGLLTTPKAVRRLLHGATIFEVNEVLARRSISPGPPEGDG